MNQTYTHVGHGRMHWRASRSAHANPREMSDHALTRISLGVYESLCGRRLDINTDDEDFGEWTGPKVHKGTDGVTCAKCAAVIARAQAAIEKATGGGETS